MTSCVSRGIREVSSEVKEGLRNLGFELTGIPEIPQSCLAENGPEATCRRGGPWEVN